MRRQCRRGVAHSAAAVPGHLAVDAGRARGAFPVHPRQLTRVAKDGEKGLHAIGLVERVARRGHVLRVALVQGDFETAGHRGPMNADEPIDRRRGAIEVQREQRASGDRHGCHATAAVAARKCGNPAARDVPKVNPFQGRVRRRAASLTGKADAVKSKTAASGFLPPDLTVGIAVREPRALADRDAVARTHRRDVAAAPDRRPDPRNARAGDRRTRSRGRPSCRQMAM